MSNEKHGPFEQQVSVSEPAIMPSDPTSPLIVFMLEVLISVELEGLSINERTELKQQSKCILDEWRNRHGGELALLSVDHDDLPLAQLRGSPTILLAEFERNILRNDIDLAQKLLAEGYQPLVRLVSEHGYMRVLATIALNDTIQAGRADSLVYVLCLLHSGLQHRLNAANDGVKHLSALPEELRKGTDAWKTAHWALTGPAFKSSLKQKTTLAKNRAKGALRNKQRAAENHARWQEMSQDLLVRRPEWFLAEHVSHIQNHAAGKKDNGRPYSAATIRNVIKGGRKKMRGVSKAPKS